VTRSFAALALVSAALGAWQLWPNLAATHARWAGVSRTEALRAAGDDAQMPADVWDFFRAHIRAGDRYVLRTPKGAPRGFVDEATVARTYASWWLLPAVQVDEEAQATIVLDYRSPGGPGAICLRPRFCVERRRP
jgi:hypothetical protein